MIYKGKLVLAEGATLQKKRKAGLCAVKYCNATSGKNGEWKLCYKHHRQNQNLSPLILLAN